MENEYLMCVFSVIIPTYNREYILNRAISSVLNQTFSDFELIIVDDGSKDATKDLVTSIGDPRIVYLYKENGGQNSALNFGLKYARGKYIAFCDSDDEWLPTKLEKCYKKYIEDEELGVVYHQTGNRVGEKIALARKDHLEGWIHKDVIIQGFLTSPTFLTCKKECFNVIGLFDLDVINCQDDDFCFNLTKYYKVGFVDEILGVYGIDVKDRKSCQSKVGAESYYFLWKKHKTDAIEVGGTYEYAKKLLIASLKYKMIHDNEMAKKIFNEAKDLYPIPISDRIDYFKRIFGYKVKELYWFLRVSIKL